MCSQDHYSNGNERGHRPSCSEFIPLWMGRIVIFSFFFFVHIAFMSDSVLSVFSRSCLFWKCTPASCPSCGAAFSQRIFHPVFQIVAIVSGLRPQAQAGLGYKHPSKHQLPERIVVSLMDPLVFDGEYQDTKSDLNMEPLGCCQKYFTFFFFLGMAPFATYRFEKDY